MALQKKINKAGLFFAALGGILGSGWLFGPLYAAQLTGPAAILTWGCGGFLMLIIAANFMELGTMFPKAGSVARFAHISHGTFAGFTMAWVVWLSSVVVAPLETSGILAYLAHYVPSLVQQPNNDLSSVGILASAGVMLLMCVMNVFGIQWITKTNNYIVIVKFFIPIFLVICLLVSHFHFTSFTSHGFAPYGLHAILTTLPDAGVIFSFMGYSAAIHLAGEAINPQKDLPIAVIGAILTGILLYTLLQFSFIGSTPTTALFHGWSHLHFSGDAGPMVGLAAQTGIALLMFLLYVNIVLSPFGTAVLYTTSTARITYALSEQKDLPSALSKLNKNGVPTRAILLNFIIGMTFFLPFPGWKSLMSFLVSAFVLAYSIGPIALLVMRQRAPQHARPFHLPAAYIMAPLAFYICNLLLVWAGWAIISHLILLVIAGFIYLAIQRTVQKEKAPLELRKGGWLILYLVGLALISYLSSFGGINDLHFGPDFGVIALFSAFILWLAVKTARN